MPLRPPLLKRSLSAFPLTRGAPITQITPRLLTPSYIRFNNDTSRPPLPRTPREPPSLSLFLSASPLSRPKPILRTSTGDDDPGSPQFPSYSGSPNSAGSEENMFRLCVYATKHNTHISFTKPNKDTILTLSCGNVGFKKANRGTFEAAYQLASVMFTKMEERDLRPKNLEIILRDFGPGRDAFTKVLLGKEGKWIRGSVRRVTDASRLKFGGTRSRAIRRL